MIQIEIQQFQSCVSDFNCFYHKLISLTFDFLTTEAQISLTSIFIWTLLQLSSATKCIIYHLTLKFLICLFRNRVNQIDFTDIFVTLSVAYGAVIISCRFHMLAVWVETAGNLLQHNELLEHILNISYWKLSWSWVPRTFSSINFFLHVASKDFKI